MSNNTQKLFFFTSTAKEDEFDEDIDNYDNEQFNAYDDGIDLIKPDVDELDDEDDDELIEDDNSLPLFNEEEMAEIDEYDEMEE
ncbi:MAG: hypothetical protein PQJ59_18625 [Spirochaetales bacterium]|nr:hypothetical protein [Spirochaetales bacterium]